jgi:hypothetical protein
MEKGMNMQDKEFDDLFRSKFGDFEVQPSAEVWQNIDAELDVKKKTSILPMLSVAASVLILLTVGILFIPKKGLVKRNKPDTNVVAKATSSMVKAEDSIEPITSLEKQRERLAAIETPVKNAMKANQPKIKTNAVEQREQVNSSIEKTEITKPHDQPLMASVGIPKQNEVTPIELTEATSAEHKATVDNSVINLPAQPVLAANLPAKKPAVKKRGIRNFGDIVNLVVAKVDKRKDKLIQFSDTDDDESVISAVHLGALKIKRDN